MHELARHVIHSSETLAMAIETMTSLIQEHHIVFKEHTSLFQPSITMSKQTRRSLRVQITMFKCLYLRSRNSEERLRNEINLVGCLCSFTYRVILMIRVSNKSVANQRCLTVRGNPSVSQSSLLI
jgi:hypothetical protein